MARATRPLTRLARSYHARAIDRGWLRRKNLVWLLAALALGFGVRVNRLAAQSLWNDEGTSVALARLSLPAIASSAAHDIHPPLYYFLLHFWIELAGASEFAVRFLSVLAGVLLIAVTFRIAREFFDQEVSLLAAILSAVSAFQLYYSQETRMYVLVALWSALSVLTMVWMFKPPRTDGRPTAARIRGRTIAWVLYILFTTAALYTHYFAFTLMLLENLAFVAWLLLARRAGRPGIRHSVAFWLAAQVIIALGFLPWLAFAGSQLTSWPAISEPLSLPDLVGRVLSAFVFGTDAPLETQVLIVAGYAVFFVAGLLPSLDLYRQSIWGIILNALWAVIPLAAMYVVSLQRPAYNPKFLLLATPGFLILAARGLSILYPGLFLSERSQRFDWIPAVDARRVSSASTTQRGRNALERTLLTWRFLFTVGIVAGGALVAIRGVYFDPRLQRDDYRGIVNYINRVARNDDAVIIDAPGQIEVFRYYYRGAAQVQTLPIGRPLQVDATRSVLSRLTDAHENLFAVLWATEQADPQNMVERYLSEVGFKATDEWHGSVRLAQYALLNTFDCGMDGGYRPPKQFGEEILLIRADRGCGSYPPGRVVPLQFSWRAIKPPSTNYKVFIHLLDAQGRIVSQRDAEPVNGFRPTVTWSSGEEIVDKGGLLVPLGLPPGDYLIEFGVYRPDNGLRLAITAEDGKPLGDHLELGRVRVEP